MQFGFFWAAIALVNLTGIQTLAEVLPCTDHRLSVDAADPTQHQEFCTAAKRALDKLARCNVNLDQNITIRVVDDLAENCLGLFHCGEGLIEVLPMDMAMERRHPESLFAGLSAQEFTESILVHEFTHAAYDNVACPYRNCNATAEYLAYTMQIMSLPPEQLKTIEAAMELDTKVSRSDVSAMMLALAPRTFASKAWIHLTQRGDKCAYIAQIMSGNIVFDIEGP